MRSACLYLTSLGLCWAQVVPMLDQVGPMLGHLAPAWAYVAPSRAHVGPILGLCWPKLGLCWAMLGPSWAHVGPKLGPCWPMLGHLCWNDLKMQFVPFRATCWSPKPRKNGCFLTSPRWKYLPPKGPKHRKKQSRGCVYSTKAVFLDLEILF